MPDIYITKKKRKLTGKRLETFNKFWVVFDYPRGKAEAADAWLDIPTLTDTIMAEIFLGAKAEALRRQRLIDAGRTPKMAQGWIAARRWEDDLGQADIRPKIQHSSGYDNMVVAYNILKKSGQAEFNKFCKEMGVPAGDKEAAQLKFNLSLDVKSLTKSIGV